MPALSKPQPVSMRSLLDSVLGQAAPTPSSPTLRAPTAYERYVQPVANAAQKVGEFFGGKTADEQLMSAMPGPMGVGAVGMTLAPRKTAEQLANIIRVAEGVPENIAQGPAMKYLREAVAYYAEKHPRLLSHLDEIVVNPTLQSSAFKKSGAIANMDMSQAHLLAQKPGGVKYLNENRRPIGTMNVSAEAMDTWALPEQAREIVGHELGHTSQFLGDPSRMGRAYQAASDTFGYAGNPAEDLSNIIGRKHRYGPRVPEAGWKNVTTLIGLDDQKQALRNWEFFREMFPRETLKGPVATKGPL